MATKRVETLHRENVKKMTDEELTVELNELRSKLFTLRSQAVTEKVEDHSSYGKQKRGIARVLTELSSRRAKSGGKPVPAAATAKPAPARKPAPRKSAAKAATK
jgi:ribosomal protein L29